MTGAWIILAVTAAVGIILWAWEKYRTRRHGASLHHHAPANPQHETGDSGEAEESAALCCGLHAICEKTGTVNEPPVYYDDEELDRFAGRDAGEYTDDETEEFRDVLLTLLPSDAPGWAESLEKRRINLPDTLKPELELMLLEC